MSSDFFLGTSSLLTSNVLLSSYPILIKKYIDNISLDTQLLIRVIMYIALAIPFMIYAGETKHIFSSLLSPSFIAISIINLIHIYSSYAGFAILDAGVSMTTFYSYPIIQVFLSNIFLGAPKITPTILLSMFGCFLGVAILNADSLQRFINSKQESKESKEVEGYLFIAIAALTEAIISVFYKKVDLKNAFTSLYTLYAPGLIFLLAYLFTKTDTSISSITDLSSLSLSKNKTFILPIIFYNMLIGGMGYMLRLYSVTKIDMKWFSALSFTSAVSAFALGNFFLGEKIKIQHWIGTTIMFLSIYMMEQ